jgi:hypothetical protein
MRSGLKKVVKTVKGKKGRVKRAYWVKAQETNKTPNYKNSLRYKLLKPADDYIRRASPVKKGLIAAGVTAAMLGSSLGAAFLLANRKTQRRRSMGG